jgi:hypothetical protein
MYKNMAYKLLRYLNTAKQNEIQTAAIVRMI